MCVYNFIKAIFINGPVIWSILRKFYCFFVTMHFRNCHHLVPYLNPKDANTYSSSSSSYKALRPPRSPSPTFCLYCYHLRIPSLIQMYDICPKTKMFQSKSSLSHGPYFSEISSHYFSADRKVNLNIGICSVFTKKMFKMWLLYAICTSTPCI